MIRDYLAIAAGGALGACTRYGIALALPHAAGEVPWATLVANIVGSFLLGVAATRISAASPFLPFVAIGFLGSLTTFSTLAYELATHATPLVALGYAAATLLFGISAAWAGAEFARNRGPAEQQPSGDRS